jgi:hypothetical protein
LKRFRGFNFRGSPARLMWAGGSGLRSEGEKMCFKVCVSI